MLYVHMVKNITNVLSKPLDVIIFHMPSVDHDTSRFQIIESLQKLNDCTFAAAAVAYKSRGLAFGDVQG